MFILCTYIRVPKRTAQFSECLPPAANMGFSGWTPALILTAFVPSEPNIHSQTQLDKGVPSIAGRLFLAARRKWIIEIAFCFQTMQMAICIHEEPQSAKTSNMPRGE